MARKMTKGDVKELLAATGIALLISLLLLVAVACIVLTIKGILKGYI